MLLGLQTLLVGAMMGGYAVCENGHTFYYPYRRGTTWRDYECPECGGKAVGTAKSEEKK